MRPRKRLSRIKLRARSKSRYVPGRRRARFVSLALWIVVLMAASLIMTTFARRATPPKGVDAPAETAANRPSSNVPM